MGSRGDRPLLVILGPTGSGKSRLALELAERLGGEIVGCDSLQVYRDLNVATGKPDPHELARVPHHLIDCVAPTESFSLGEYVELARAALARIVARDRQPLVVGGTGMYLRGLLRGVVELPPRNPEFRDRLMRVVERRGTTDLHRWLERLDPVAAGRIAATDAQRIVRGLELAHHGGGNWSERLSRAGGWEEARERLANVKIGLTATTEWLNPRIDARVERFFSDGLIAEVRGLIRDGVPLAAHGFKAIGYREVLGALVRGDDPELTREAVKRSTRRYAKRQRIWFRREPAVHWIDAAEELPGQVSRALEFWERGRAETR